MNTTPPDSDLQLLAQIRAALGLHRRLPQQVVAAREGREQLVVEVVAVGDHDDGRVFHRRVQDQPPGIEGHRQALARALRVPDDADPLVARLAAGAVAGEIGAGRLLGFRREIGGPQRLLDRDIDRVELVISRDLLRERAAAEILEHNEMADEIEKPARLEHAGEHDLQFGQARRRILAPADRAPRLEPFLARAERADAGLHAVRGDQRRVVGEQRRDEVLIIFELLDGIPHCRVLVGRVFQLDDAERQPVDEDHDVGAAALLPFDDGELIDRQPVVLLGPVEIDDLRLGAGNRPVRSGVFDIDAVDQHAMQRAVAGEQVRRLDPQQFAVGVEDRRRR